MIGVDIVAVDRIKKAAESEHFLRRVYSESELEYAKGRQDFYATLSGLFAAKEAVLKALKTGINTLNLNEICIKRGENNAPYCVYKGKDFAISIAHEGEYAIAVALILKN